MSAPSVHDVCVWADGTACYRGDLQEYGWKSDDYLIIPFDTPEWIDAVESL